MCGEQGFKAVYKTGIRLILIRKAKVSQFFLVECLCYATGYKLLYSSRIRIWYLPGRTTTEQIYKFPVCANFGVLFSLDILLQACEKHIETRFSL